MEDFINSYELDFIKDIPVEHKKLEVTCKSLKESNNVLSVVLVTIICVIGLTAYQTYYNKKKNSLNYLEFN